jgi:hypothetical protein
MNHSQGDKVKIKGDHREHVFICWREVFVAENSNVKKTVALVEVDGERIEVDKYNIRFLY